MRKENKKDIWDVLKLLQKRDPEWKCTNIALKFRILYSGWVAQELRQNKHTQRFYSIAWKRKWLAYEDWIRFRNYAMQ